MAGNPPGWATCSNAAKGDKSLKLLDDIYQRVASRSSSFLSADELAKFQEFKTTAINNNRAALAINRTMMASISK